MADSDNSEKTPAPRKPAKKEEISVERRMLLAFVLMGVVLFATQFFYKPQPQDTIKPTKPASTQQAKPPEPATAQSPAAVPAPAASAGQIAAAKEEFFALETDVYKIRFSNHGAVVRSWQLKQYRDGTGKLLELVNGIAGSKTHFPFSVLFENQKPATDINQSLYVAKPAADGLGIDYEFSDGRTTARKSFRFSRNSYMSQITSEVANNGAGIPHLLAWRGGFGDQTVAAAAAAQKTLYFDASQNKLVQNEAKSASSGPHTVGGTFTFSGIEDNFFAAVFLPRDNRQIRLQTLSDSVAIEKDGKEEAHVGAAVGGDTRNTYSLFVGPKDLDLLTRVDPKLASLVDFGWFSILAKPLFLALNWLNDRFIHNYGWSIILVTVAINFLLLPLKLSSMQSMKKMSSLQPQIAAINDRYKNVGMRDPKKAQQNQEVMDLYKKNGVNPMGGCVPLLLQIPFFFAFYKVLSVAIELRGAGWLWVHDLSQYDPIYILPVAMVATQFFVQKMTPATTADPAQQKMMLFMPLMLGFLFLKASSGLVLYWLTGNVVSLVQQWFMNRSNRAPVPAVIDVKPAGKRNTGRK